MKKHTFTLHCLSSLTKVMYVLAGLLIISVGLSALPPNPRTLYFRLVEANGNSLAPDTTGINFQATMLGITKDKNAPGFGVVYGNGNMYARIQLGNFGVEWTPGEVVSFTATSSGYVGMLAYAEITIPEGSGAIWWGQPLTNGKEYPGNPIHFYPYSLLVNSIPKSGNMILKDGIATGNATNQTIIPSSIGDITGVFSLEPAPNGYVWEPSSYNVSLKDFTFSEKATSAGKGAMQPGYSHTIEFRLVKSK